MRFIQHLLNDSTIVFSGFENFSFNLYRDKINRNDADTILTAMTFPSTAEKWSAGKITGDVEKQKLKYVNEYTLDYAQSQVSTDPIFGTQGRSNSFSK